MNIYPPGSIIANRYEVAGCPLMGGMGIVYLCMDHQEERPVALKTFRPEYLPDHSARDRFLREGTTWVDLGCHPHIVRCYNIDRIGDGREVYLALEMVAKAEGRQDASLRSWLMPGQPLPVEQALLFALQIVRGMKHATDTIPGFVHRDLKPENVLVGADWLSSLETNRLRVTDFGLANVLQEASDTSSISEGIDPGENQSRTQLTHGIVGTPQYMAPEQWQAGKFGVNTDVYALGCILYEMLTGERAVLGDSLQTLKQAHRQGKVAAMPNNIPTAVINLVEDCLHIDPEQRPQDWEQLETALGKAWEQIKGQELPKAESSQKLERNERVASGWSYSNMGLSYLDIGKADVARGYFERAHAVGRDEEERRLEAAGLTHLGTACDHLGDARQAIDLYDQTLVILREIGDRRGEGIALGNLGNSYRNLGDIRRAIGFYEQALIISLEIGGRGEEGADLGNLGTAYADLGDFRQAISFYEQALAIDREIGNRRGESNALGNMGNAFADLGDATRAIGFYEQALVIDREIGDRRAEGATLGNLGNSYRNLGDLQRAISFLKQQLGITREIEDRRGEGNALESLGIAFAPLGDTWRAIEFFEQALEIRREIGDMIGAATGSFNMALLYQQEREPQKALSLSQEADRIFSQIGHTQNAQLAQQLIARLQGEI